MSFTDSLRGYAHPIHKRDGFTCVYCGWDGSQWPNWLFLSRDHLLPEQHPKHDDKDFIFTACRFCNEVHNKTSFDVEDKSPNQIVAIKRQAVLASRAKYKEFWDQNVR